MCAPNYTLPYLLNQWCIFFFHCYEQLEGFKDLGGRDGVTGKVMKKKLLKIGHIKDGIACSFPVNTTEVTLSPYWS